VDHNLAENELLASGITGKRATPHHVGQSGDLQSPVCLASPTRHIKQCNDSTPKHHHRTDCTVAHNPAQGTIRVYRHANPEQPDTIVPPPPCPFILAGKLPTPTTAKTRPVVNISPEQLDATIVPPPPRPFILVGKLPTPVTAKTRPAINISPEHLDAAIVPPPSRPFILVGELPTPVTAKTRPVINISGAKGSDKHYKVSVLTVGNMRMLMKKKNLAGQ